MVDRDKRSPKVEVVFKPSLKRDQAEARIAHNVVMKNIGPKLSLADRIRNAVGAPTDLSPKAVRAYLHGLKINMRNLANEVEKLESAHSKENKPPPTPIPSEGKKYTP